MPSSACHTYPCDSEPPLRPQYHYLVKVGDLQISERSPYLHPSFHRYVGSIVRFFRFAHPLTSRKARGHGEIRI